MVSHSPGWYWGWSRSIMGFPINQAVSRDRGFWTQQFILTKIHVLIQHDHHDPTTKGHQDCQVLVLIWKKFNISAEGWLTWEPTPSGSTMSLGQKFRVMASYCLASSSESMIYHATSGVKLAGIAISTTDSWCHGICLAETVVGCYCRKF